MPDPNEPDELDTTSIELEDEDGNPIRIAQQNAGPGNQVGQGEFKPVTDPKDPGEADAEQEYVDLLYARLDLLRERTDRELRAVRRIRACSQLGDVVLLLRVAVWWC